MHRTLLTWRGERYSSLKDIISRDLDILFVGINPSIVSVESGHNHRGILGQRFWDTIIQAGILKPRAGYYFDEICLEQKIGLTDLVKRPGQRMNNLDREDFDTGRGMLFEKIVEYKPRIVCAIYKAVFEKLFETRFTNIHGLIDNYRIGRSHMFIMAPFFYPRPEREKTAGELKNLRIQLTKSTKK